MCNPFAIASTAASMAMTMEQNSQVKALNRAKKDRFSRVQAAAEADFAAATGDAEAAMLQQSEAEGQELNRLTREAAKAAGAIAATRGGSGNTLGLLMNDINKAESEYRASSRRNMAFRRGEFGRMVGAEATRAKTTTQAAYQPPTPTTGMLPMMLQAGAAGLTSFASTGGMKWEDLFAE